MRFTFYVLEFQFFFKAVIHRLQEMNFEIGPASGFSLMGSVLKLYIILSEYYIIPLPITSKFTRLFLYT